MKVQELKKKLQAQLAALEEEGEYEVTAFNVWSSHKLDQTLGEDFIRDEERSWGWGFCRRSNCRHHSHDPYTEGDTVFVRCRYIGKGEDDDDEIYVTKSGVVFSYRYAKDAGYHFAPTAAIRLGPVT